MAYQRFDFTQKGSGLASQGYSLSNPQQVYEYYQRMLSNPHSDNEKNFTKKVQEYAKNNKGSWTDPNYVSYAVDWAFRDAQRNNQKAPRMFGALDGILKPAITLGASLINPALGAVVGGGLGAANGGGLLGGALGALGGYGAGSGFKSLTGALSNAGGFSTLMNAPGTFASNLGRGALTSLQNSIPGYGGSLSAGAGGLGAAASKVPTGLLSSILGGGGNNSSGGGGNVSFFGDLLQSAIPSLISGGISYAGSQNALEAQQKAAQQAAAMGAFKPYNISGPLGSASFNGTTASANMSPELAAQFAQMTQMTNGAFKDYTDFNAGGYAQNMYDTLTAYKRPTDQAQTNDLLNRVYATGNWGSTTGAQDVYSYQQAKNLEDQMMRLQSQQAGAQEQDRLFNRYFNAAQGAQSTAAVPYSLIATGGNLGNMQASAGAQAAQFPWTAAQNASDASAAFWTTIGGMAGNAANSVINKYGSYSSNNNRPITVASPGYSIGMFAGMGGYN